MLIQACAQTNAACDFARHVMTVKNGKYFRFSMCLVSVYWCIDVCVYQSIVVSASGYCVCVILSLCKRNCGDSNPTKNDTIVNYVYERERDKNNKALFENMMKSYFFIGKN